MKKVESGVKVFEVSSLVDAAIVVNVFADVDLVTVNAGFAFAVVVVGILPDVVITAAVNAFVLQN